MTIGRRNRDTRRNPASVPFCPTQNPHDLTWDLTEAASVRRQRLTNRVSYGTICNWLVVEQMQVWNKLYDKSFGEILKICVDYNLGPSIRSYVNSVKVKVIPVTGRECPQGCETSKLPHFLQTIGSQMAVKLLALSAARPSPLREIPGTHFCQRLSRPQGHSVTGKIRSIDKSNDLIGNRTHDLPACSIVSQTTMLPRCPNVNSAKCFIWRLCLPGP
jgi:hypothetical protein